MHTTETIPPMTIVASGLFAIEENATPVADAILLTDTGDTIYARQSDSAEWPGGWYVRVTPGTTLHDARHGLDVVAIDDPQPITKPILHLLDWYAIRATILPENLDDSNKARHISTDLA